MDTDGLAPTWSRGICGHNDVSYFPYIHGTGITMVDINDDTYVLVQDGSFLCTAMDLLYIDCAAPNVCMPGSGCRFNIKMSSYQYDQPGNSGTSYLKQGVAHTTEIHYDCIFYIERPLLNV